MAERDGLTVSLELHTEEQTQGPGFNSDQDNSDSSSQSLPQSGAPEGIDDDGADLLWQCKQLAKGVYGLPEAIGDIRELKIKLATVNADRAGLSERARQMTEEVEQLVEENRQLRKKAGLSPSDTIDLSAVKLAKDNAIAELRAENSCMQVEIGQLEEQQKNLKAHLRLHAKHGSQIPVDLELSADQLTKIADFVQQLKSKQQGQPAPEDLHIADAPQSHAESTRMPAPDSVMADKLTASQALLADDTAIVLSLANQRTAHQQVHVIDEQQAPQQTKCSLEPAAAVTSDLPQEGMIAAQKLADQLGSASRDGTVSLHQETNDLLHGVSVLPPADCHTKAETSGWTAQHDKGEDCQADASTSRSVADSGEASVAESIAEPNLTKQQTGAGSTQLGRQPRVPEQEAGGSNNGLAAKAPHAQHLQKASAQLAPADKDSSRAVSELSQQAEADNSIIEMQDELSLTQQRVVELAQEVVELRQKVSIMQGHSQGYIAKCEELQKGMQDILEGMPPQALERKYADAVSNMANMKLRQEQLQHQLQAVTAAETQHQAERSSEQQAAAAAARRMTARLRAAQAQSNRLTADLQQARADLQQSPSQQAFDSVRQQLHSLSERHTALVQQQITTESRALEVARLRSEVAKGRTEAGLLADKMVTAQETCRIQQKQLDSLLGQDDGAKGLAVEATLEPALVKDLVEGQVSLAAALRRADRAEQQERLAEQGREQGHHTLEQAEAHLALLSAQLHQAHQDHQSLQKHYEGGACYEEVHELWQRVNAAEQASAHAQKQLQSHKDAAAHATLQLKLTQTESKTRHAEGAALRNALRQAQAVSSAPESLADMQAELTHLRRKLVMAQGSETQLEAECSSLQDDNQRLSHKLARTEANLSVTHIKLRWQKNQCLQATAAHEAALAGQIPVYKADTWLRKMTDLSSCNTTLAEQAQILSQRLLAAEEARNEADSKLQHMLQSQRASQNDLVDAQTDRTLQLRLENAKLSRTEATLRAKGTSLEEALRALEGRLAEQEDWALAQHAALEHGKYQAEKRCVELEAMTHDLQTSLSTQDAKLTEMQVRLEAAETHAAQRAVGQEKTRQEEERAAGKTMQATTRNVLLAQVEQVRQSRLETEAFKEQLAQANHQLSNQASTLHHLRQQHKQLLQQVCEQRQRALAEPAEPQHEGAALEQVQALAQATIQDLHNQLAAKSGEVEDGKRQVQAVRNRSASEVAALQDQLEQLTLQLQLQDERHVQALKAGSQAPAQSRAFDSSPRLTHLTHLVNQLTQDRDACQARQRQLQAEYEWKVGQLQQHVQERQQQCTTLATRLQAAQQAERSQQRRQALAAAAKDAKLGQLRGNMQQLEAKLIHALQAENARQNEGDKGQQQLQTALKDKAETNRLLQTALKDKAETQGLLQTALKDKAETQGLLHTALQDKQEGQALLQRAHHEQAQASMSLQTARQDQARSEAAMQAALEAKAQMQATVQQLQAEVKELQFQSMLAATAPSPSSHSPAPASTEAADTQQDATAYGQDTTPNTGGQDSQIKVEVSKLLAENAALAGRLAEAERGVTEAGLALQQKEGHLQGLQKLLEEEERSGRSLQQQLKQQLASQASAAAACTQDMTSKLVQAEKSQQEVVQLQQQVHLLEAKLKQAESDHLTKQAASKQPLQEQQLPQKLSSNPPMAEALADVASRPEWMNPMASHLSEAEKAELQTLAEGARAKAEADENGAPGELLGGHPGLLQWEEKKKMQKRLDTLRTKLKEKSSLVEQLERQKQRKGEQVQQAQADLARQAVLIKQLQNQTRLKATPGVPADQVRELVKKITGLEEQRDALERQLVAIPQQGPAIKEGDTPSEASDMPLQDQLLFKESELVEARLERSQAEAKAQRAQQRLDDFLAQQPNDQGGQKGVGEGSKQTLLDTIQGLQRALERSKKECESAVSSAKYMQMLEKKKELGKRCSSLEEEARLAAGIKEEAHRLEQRCQQLQAANTALKKQLKPLQEGHLQAKALTEQVEELQAAAESKAAELMSLRNILQHKEAQVAQLKEAEGALDEEAAGQIAALREKLSIVEAENNDMREELSAFDPAFFDEIEDLKYDHHQLQLQCQEYESIVRELSSQLGIDAASLSKLKASQEADS